MTSTTSAASAIVKSPVCSVSVIDFLLCPALDTAHECRVFFNFFNFLISLLFFSKYFQILGLIGL